MIKGYDIVIVGQQPWDTEIGSNCKDIALELSKHNRVLYVNSPLDRITIVKGREDSKIQKRLNNIKKNKVDLHCVQDNLWSFYPNCVVESINWISSNFLFNIFNKRNNKKFSKSILEAIQALNFKSFILFNDNEIFKAFYLKAYLMPELSIYYSRDYMLGVDYWRRHGSILEPKLIAQSDLCFTNSEFLAEYCRKFNTETYNVGQGCEFESLINFPRNAEPKFGPERSTIIGYVGSLNSARLSLEIISSIAESFPHFTIVLVGQEDEVFKKSSLHSYPNVLFVGRKGVDELPSYINSFDVCINPQLVNEITIGNYPRKIDEYLAMGKPVVATNTKTMSIFKDYVYLAESPQDYCRLIRRAIEENTSILEKQRIDFASSHTWKKSVEEMSLHITNKLFNKYPK